MIFRISDDGTHAIPSAECIEIPEFQALLSRNRGTGLRELLFVYHTCDIQSPYYRIEDSRREEVVGRSFLPEKWKPDVKVKEAQEKYRELTRTVYHDLMDAGDIGIHKLKRYFETVDLTELDDKGKPIYSARDLVSNLEKLGAVVRSHAELRALIEEERTEGQRNRKQVRTNNYSA